MVVSMTKDEALKLALEALESLVQPDNCEHGYWWEDCPNDECEKVKDMKAITAIKEALAQPDDLDVWKVRALQAEAVIEKFMAQPEQEPVGLIESLKDAQPCCGEYQTCWRACTPRGKFLAQRTWVGLTDEEKQEWIDAMPYDPEPRHCMILVNVIEVKLKEKNT
jgi:hypothetical protein